MLIQSLNVLYCNNCQCRQGNKTIFIANKPLVNWFLISLKGKALRSYLCNSAEATPDATVGVGLLASIDVRFGPVFRSFFPVLTRSLIQTR